MRYPPSVFWNGLPAWKRRKDPPLTRIFYRPMSYLTASLFSELGLSANMVSFISILVSFAAFGCFYMCQPIIGAILVNVWLILDCTDGNIARCVKREAYGDFIDGIAGYICSALTFLGLGWSAFWMGGVIFQQSDPIIFFLGASAAICELLSRLIFQKYTNVSYEQGGSTSKEYDPSKVSGFSRVRLKIDQFVSVGGILPAAVLAAAIANALDLILVVWGIYFIAAFLVVTFVYTRKVL